MAGIVDLCRFNPTAGGTTDWTFSSAVTGYQSPTAAGAQNGRVYKYRAESADLSQWEEGEGAYSSGTGVFARTTVFFNSAGTTAKINFTLTPQVAVVFTKQDMIVSDESCLAVGMTNGTLVASAAAGALTVSVKTVAGNDPSALDPVFFYFRNNTLATGDAPRIAVTAALSVVLGSTTTLGATSGLGLRVWIAAFNNAGTVQLAAMNCSDANGVYCPQESVKFTTAVPANASKTWYSTSAIATAAPWRFIGFCEWSSLATAGTWVAPSVVQLFGPGMKKPGDVLQRVQATTTTQDTGTTATTPNAGPFTASITPQATANVIKASFGGVVDGSGALAAIKARIQRGTTWQGASALLGLSPASGGGVFSGTSFGYDLPSSIASTTYTVYRWSNSASVTTICPYTDSATVGAVIELEELMG